MVTSYFSKMTSQSFSYRYRRKKLQRHYQIVIIKSNGKRSNEVTSHPYKIWLAEDLVKSWSLRLKTEEVAIVIVKCITRTRSAQPLSIKKKSAGYKNRWHQFPVDLCYFFISF